MQAKACRSRGHAIKCVLASIEVSQLDIERTCYAPIADIQDMLEVDEARVRHFIETGQLETFLFEGDQLVILESDNMCEARMQRLERFEESGKGIDWDW